MGCLMAETSSLAHELALVGRDSDPRSKAECRCHVLIVCPKHLPVQYAQYGAQHSTRRPEGSRL